MSRFKIIVLTSLIILTAGEFFLNKKINKLNNRPLVFLESPQSPIPLPSSASSPVLSSQPEVEPSLTPSVKPITTPTVSFQPQMIYLGSASSSQTNWTETDIQASLNSQDYPNDINAVFEAGLAIINGQAWARLKNKTTGAVMSITEIYNNNNSVTLKTSPSFKLYPGNNIYVVEIKSSSSEMAHMSGARIRISK